MDRENQAGETVPFTPGSDPGELARRHQASARPRENMPASIGPYKILQELGDGGMGTVYLAEQTKPIHRRVALKIIKAGMDTRQIIARFETEREALALMDHPNIAKVLDAGTAESGRPYVVMEYVHGISITDYCDKNRLTTEHRLRLFVDVCLAVQHAHQKGVIHRDLKPSNVLVAVQEERPVPKIIDFGVAKATQHRLTERTVYTEYGQLIGTPGYMSPEQANLTALDIDTRTDIYSLGVLLYELLVGAMPFDTKQLLDIGFGEIQRVIREVDPPKPSTRLSSLGADSTVVAHKRHTEPKTLARQLRGDLDWIVMKCLEKDRTRRYATASELALEIRRHLDHQPVLAGPPRISYRMRKFVRRNRTGVGLAVVLVAAAAVSGYFYWAGRQAEFAIARAMQYAEQAKTVQLQAEPAKDPAKQKKYLAAWKYAEEALALDPNNSLALRTKAYLLLNERGDFEAALKAYDRGLRPLEDAHMLPEDFHNRARLRRIFGQNKLALEDHNRAIALTPGVAWIYAGRAITYRFLGQIDQAMEDLTNAAKLRSSWALQGNLWIWEMRMMRGDPGDRDAAAEALVQARSADSGDPFDQLYVGISGGAVTAEQALTRTRNDKDRSYAYYYLGAKAMVDGRAAEAENWFKKCVASGQHRTAEFDLARWHIGRLSSQ